jgi:hypothetical protein
VRVGLSKWTSYSKNYHPDANIIGMSASTVRMSAPVRNYPADGKNPSTQTSPVRVDTLKRLRGHCPSVGAACPPPRLLPLSIPHVHTDAVYLPRARCLPSAQMLEKKQFLNFIFLVLGSCCPLEKRKNKSRFQFSTPKIPKIPGLRGRSCKKKKVFST